MLARQPHAVQQPAPSTITTMVFAVVSPSVVDDIRARLSERDGTDVELVAVNADGTGFDVTRADALLRWDLDDAGFRSVLDRASGLRWVHSPSAGVEHWPLQELANRNITLTNAAGVFAIPIAEWVLATMLRIVKRVDALVDAQREHRWVNDFAADELHGKTLLVLGTGGIGGEIITRAQAFGMRVWGSNRSGRSVPGAEWVVRGEAWREVLPQVDFLVSTLPLTDETRQMINEAELASLHAGAWVINVGRGATINEDALVDAVRNGRIGGAALDAWTTEPLPPDHPAWTLPNVIISPHASGSSPAGRDRGLDLFVENLLRFTRGEQLANEVDLKSGY
jgi:phosphoglycerate dehydrogenase-like enzyme